MKESMAWFPLYIADYLADTMGLSAAEHGIYVLMMMHSYRKGKLPADPKQVSEIIGQRGSRNLAIIKKITERYFHVHENDSWNDNPCTTITNARVNKERAKALEISAKRSASAMQKHSKSSANSTQSQSQSQIQKNKKKKASSPSAPHPFEQEFEDLWARYPKRIGKPAAAASFKKHIKTLEDLEQLKQALKNYLAHLETSGSFEYAVHGSTFFNGNENRENYKGWKGFITAEVIQKPLTGEERKQLQGRINNLEEEIKRLNNNIIFFEEQGRKEDLQDARRKVAIKQAIIADLKVQLGEKP